MTDYTNVASRAVLATLTISVWSAMKFDRGVSEEITDQKHADRSAGRFNKHLFGSRRTARQVAPLFAAVLDAGDAMRDLHDRETLPWGKRDGERLLPTTNYFIYMERMRAARNTFDAAADAFVEAYPALKAAAQTRLAALYRESDFPKPCDVRRLFRSAVHIDPVPVAGDIRAALPEDQIAEIERSITERVEQSARDAMGDAWRRLYDAVARIKKASGSRDDGKAGVVRSTLIDNVSEVCDVLKRLNVAEDERLEALRRRVEMELAGIAVEDLRKDERLRQDTASRAAEIMAAMGAFYAPDAADEATA